MKKFRHRITGDWVEKVNNDFYKLQADGRTIPVRLIENCNDWEQMESKVDKSNIPLQLVFELKLHNSTPILKRVYNLSANSLADGKAKYFCKDSNISSITLDDIVEGRLKGTAWRFLNS